MRLTTDPASVLTSLLVGILLGYVGGPVWILIIWGVVGLVIGLVSFDTGSALTNSALYGFAASFTFLVYGYNGTAPITSYLVLFLALGAFGATCGLVLGIIGHGIHGLFRRRT